ncbi:MAG: dihydroxyacetone kinase subunit L [Clostridiales Family XIII bacterium]|jgi:dihydroxyacetone kinase|nr:dihydroxyacetone kinase subunit L [Clostridiales Family XIII bacterium]
MSVTVTDVKDVVRRMSEIIIENEARFCELDSAAGDGDFGMSLSKGFREILARIDEIDGGNAFRFLRGCSMIIAEYCGGASGPIWSSAFTAAASSSRDKESLTPTDVSDMFLKASFAIMRKGGAKPGDKTLLDALVPASDALRDAVSRGKTLNEAFGEAAKAAESGVERTKGMVASKGRASYLGERSVGHPDAGAVAVAVLFRSLLTRAAY